MLHKTTLLAHLVLAPPRTHLVDSVAILILEVRCTTQPFPLSLATHNHPLHRFFIGLTRLRGFGFARMPTHGVSTRDPLRKIATMSSRRPSSRLLQGSLSQSNADPPPPMNNVLSLENTSKLTRDSPGFGTSNNNNSTTSLFGNNKPTFGAAPASTGGTMFGSTQTGTTGGFGGANFGQSSANQSSGFSFGQKSGGFASTSNAPGTSLFGGGNPSTNAFGQSSNTNSFGAGTALQNSAVPPSDGTGSTAFTPHIEKDSNVSGAPTNHYQSITFMQPYQKYSFEVSKVARSRW